MNPRNKRCVIRKWKSVGFSVTKTSPELAVLTFLTRCQHPSRCRDLANTFHRFQQNGMKANPEKYQALVLGNSDYDISIKCVDKLIPISKDIKLLGITRDNRLKFDAHIADICRKVGGQVNALNRLKNILPCNKTREELYRAFILPYFTYSRFSCDVIIFPNRKLPVLLNFQLYQIKDLL